MIVINKGILANRDTYCHGQIKTYTLISILVYMFSLEKWSLIVIYNEYTVQILFLTYIFNTFIMIAIEI